MITANAKPQVQSTATPEPALTGRDIAPDEEIIIQAFQMGQGCLFSFHRATDRRVIGEGGAATVLTPVDEVAVGRPIVILLGKNGDEETTFTVDKREYHPKVHGVVEGQTRFYWEARFRLEPNTANAKPQVQATATPEAKEM